MKIESIKSRLEEVLSKADKIANKNANLPILAGIYLEAKQNNLLIKATNLDLGISLSLPVKVIEAGTCVVPSYTINSFISSLSSDKNVIISVKDQMFEVKTPSTKTTIKTLPKEEFPIIPEVDNDKSFSMPAADFIFGIKSVVYASSTGSIKPELSSVSITSDKDSLVFAATDSFRLAEKRVKTRKIPNFKQILIPQKNALEIIRILDKNDEIFISLEENQIGFRVQNIYLTSRLIDGSFPDYRQIIPKENICKATVLKQDLINSIKTNAIFSDSFNQLTLKLSPKKKVFEIETKNQLVGENICIIESVMEGQDINISVNHRYLSDCLSFINSEKISLAFGGQNKPIVVSGTDDQSFIYLVMPMNQ